MSTTVLPLQLPDWIFDVADRQLDSRVPKLPSEVPEQTHLAGLVDGSGGCDGGET